MDWLLLITVLQTKESKRLKFENFDGPFITHGIDVITDPKKPEGEAVYIFAVNHVPNEAVYPRVGGTPGVDPGTAPKAASRIEVFHHVIGSDSVKHVRTISHPLIKTPNDIYAVSPSELYVSNDHYCLEGRLRAIEDAWPGTAWSNVVRATVSEDGSVEASVALDKLHNPNGMGHGRGDDEILVTSALGGNMWIGKLRPEDKTISVEDNIEIVSTTDNPSYFSDPYSAVGGDASGFIRKWHPKNGSVNPSMRVFRSGLCFWVRGLGSLENVSITCTETGPDNYFQVSI